MLFKFITSLVVENKKFLIELGIIKETDVLAKDKGEYCPFKDIWELA